MIIEETAYSSGQKNTPGFIGLSEGRWMVFTLRWRKALMRRGLRSPRSSVSHSRLTFVNNQKRRRMPDEHDHPAKPFVSSSSLGHSKQGDRNAVEVCPHHRPALHRIAQREESMSQMPIWFERRFEFSFPVELHPNLSTHLRGTPARLEEALRVRSHKIRIRKVEEKWSAQEHAGHLLDLEPLWVARVGDYVVASNQLTAADLKNRKTDEANHNASPLEKILGDFRAARERLLKRIDELDPSLFARAIPHRV